MEGILTRSQTANLSTGRKRNDEIRGREFLTVAEVERVLIAAQTRGRHTERDFALWLLTYRHGLRISEVLGLRWDAIALDEATMYVDRVKGSKSGLHPLQPDEVEALRALKAKGYPSHHLFVSERGKLLSRAGAGKQLTRCGELAELDIKIHPHMFRHSCGYYLANQGYDTRLIQEWLGHRDIRNTETYTAMNTARFNTIKWGES